MEPFLLPEEICRGQTPISLDQSDLLERMEDLNVPLLDQAKIMLRGALHVANGTRR